MLRIIGIVLIMLSAQKVVCQVEIGKVDMDITEEFIKDSFGEKSSYILNDSKAKLYYENLLKKVIYFKSDGFPKDISVIILENKNSDNKNDKDLSTFNPLTYNLFYASNETKYFKLNNTNFIIGVKP